MTRNTFEWFLGILVLSGVSACTLGAPADGSDSDEGSDGSGEEEDSDNEDSDNEDGDDEGKEGGESEGTEDGPTADTGDPACAASDGEPLELIAGEASNYAFSSELSVMVTSVAPSAELTVEWGTVTEDLLGHPVDPVADIDMLSLIVWNLPYSELVVRLNDDSLGQRYFSTMVNFLPADTGVTQAGLFEFKAFGGVEVPPETLLGYLDPVAFPPETTSFTIMAATGEMPGQGTRMLAAFAPDPASTNSVVALTNDSTSLTFDADLTSLAPTQVPAATSNIEVDFGELTTNAMGNPFVFPTQADVMVAHYASLTPTDLEAQFLDLELISDAMWRGTILAGSKIELSELTDEAGAPFPGIGDTGTWVLALLCGNCSNPAPPYMTILQSCTAD